LLLDFSSEGAKRGTNYDNDTENAASRGGHSRLAVNLTRGVALAFIFLLSRGSNISSYAELTSAHGTATARSSTAGFGSPYRISR